MPKRSSSGGRKDTNRLAAPIVAQATGDVPLTDDGKNAAAVALGRLGGIKGGAARAAKLSTKRKQEIARLAAEARWGKKRG